MTAAAFLPGPALPTAPARRAPTRCCPTAARDSLPGFTSAHIVDDFLSHPLHPAAKRGRFSGLHLHHHPATHAPEPPTRTHPRTHRPRPRPRARGTPAAASAATQSEEASKLVRVVSMLQSFDISIEDCGKMVKRYPALLDLDIPVDVDRVVAKLTAAPIHMRTAKEVGRAMRNAPQIFHRFKEPGVIDRRLDFLIETLRIPAKDLPVIIAARPHLLWMDLENARRVLAWLTERCGVAEGKRRGLVVKVPQVLLATVESLDVNAKFLREEVGFADNDTALGRFIVRYPQCLCLRVETTLTRRVEYLRSLGLKKEVVRTVVDLTPEILEESVEATLQKKVDVLKDWGLESEEDIARIISKAPAFFSADLSEHLNWLSSIGLDDEQVAKVVRNLPAVLIYSVPTNLAPKWEYLSNVMGGTVDDLVNIPSFFGYNLEQRIMPRFAFVGSKGLRDTLTVPEILNNTDKEFCEATGLSYEEYRVFEETGGSLLFHTPLL